ncbi:MAG: hypothetical protein Q7R39_17075, partial [Dehalococcoidia bacterium]|nr:hypothetical protein [Dehalococcoidia bacterium]
PDYEQAQHQGRRGGRDTAMAEVTMAEVTMAEVGAAEVGTASADAPFLDEESGQTHLCRACGSSSAVKFGRTARGHQRFRCKKCQRTSVEGNAGVGMRYPRPVIAMAVQLREAGASFRKVQLELGKAFGVSPDPSNIRRWVQGKQGGLVNVQPQN